MELMLIVFIVWISYELCIDIQFIKKYTEALKIIKKKHKKYYKEIGSPKIPKHPYIQLWIPIGRLGMDILTDKPMPKDKKLQLIKQEIQSLWIKLIIGFILFITASLLILKNFY